MPSNLGLQREVLPIPQRGLFMSKYLLSIDHGDERNSSGLCPFDTLALYHKALPLAVPALESPKQNRIDSRIVQTGVYEASEATKHIAQVIVLKCTIKIALKSLCFGDGMESLLFSQLARVSEVN